MSPSTEGQDVPTTQSLDYIYESSELPAQQKRWAALQKQFRELYGKGPDFIARSPGRVNIIGEHIDYSLYDVLPMAISGDVLVAINSTEASQKVKASLSNMDSKKFTSREFEFGAKDDIEIDSSTHEWSNYFKAGYQGALSLMRSKDSSFTPRCLSVLVDGTVPAGGGLSSSAAFVCASALAVLHANISRPISKKELVELAIVSERAVGVNSGGMDQAASVFSTRGNALSVSFSPELRAEPIAFPKTEPPITFMIAQSFVAADKHVTGPECYNLRVVECTLAAELIAARLNLELEADHGPLGRSLRGLQNAYFNRDSVTPEEANKTQLNQLSTMVQLVEENLADEEGYTREQIAECLNISMTELEKRFMTKFPVRTSKFHLHQRALHVFNEAIRVARFQALLKSPPPGDDPTALMEQLGELMNQTQHSCREMYQCSCPELDELCDIAREAGSYGSRLTGAGWGGCSVHLVPKDKVAAIRGAWEEKYYRKRFPNITPETLAEAVVVSVPQQGSVMYVSLLLDRFYTCQLMDNSQL